MRNALRAMLLATVAASFAMLAATPAGAAIQWYEHYQRGLDLAAESRWEEALTEFLAAAAVEPRARRQIRTSGNNFIFEYDPHYHIARCQVELGRWVPAGGQLRLAGRAGVTPREKLEPLRRRIEAALLRSGAERPFVKPPVLSVTSEPSGARVLVDGELVGTTPLGPVPSTPGERTVRVEAPGHVAAERKVTLGPGEPVHLDLVLSPLPGAARFSSAAPTEPPAAQRPSPEAPTPLAATPTAAPAGVQARNVTPAAATAPLPSPEPRVTAPVNPARAHTPSMVPFLVGAAVVVAALALLLAFRRRPRTPVEVTAPTRLQDVRTLHAAPTPTQLGEFELIGTLGRGGMATTHRARRLRDGCEVALKIPHDSCLADDTFVARFLREGGLGEQLHHPGIVRILHVGEHSGRPYLAMELVAGHTLKQEIRDKGPLEVRRSLEIARDIAEALDYAHAKGVIHRDLKPDNVMLQPSGALKVMDFGIARVAGHAGLTNTNLFLGTPLYAAPEMVDPKHVDHRIDLYALGIILFEMLQGTVPFYADSPYRVLEMHLREPLPARRQLRRSVPEPVWSVVERLCAKDRDERFQSAQALLVELNRLLNAPLPE